MAANKELETIYKNALALRDFAIELAEMAERLMNAQPKQPSRYQLRKKEERLKLLELEASIAFRCRPKNKSLPCREGD